MSRPDTPFIGRGTLLRIASPEEDGKVRRLAAIVCADIVGYSRLMEKDEEGTHARVKSLLRDTVNPTVLEHRGRIIKNMGDGFLAMFDSPLEAVRSAIVIQQSMAMRNLIEPDDVKMQYRVGVNLGDVILDGDDIFGDGVNVAARLQTLCTPGDVYISGGIYEQVKNKLVVGYQALGDEKLKNITDPVQVYRVLSDPAAFARARPKKRGGWLIPAVAAACLALVALAGWALLYFANPFRNEQPRVARSAQQLSADSAPTPQAPPPDPSVRPAPPAAALPTPPPTTAPEPARPEIAQKQATPAPAPPPTPQPQPLNLKEPFRDCANCPEMIAIVPGSFEMGSNDVPYAKPIHHVTILTSFAIGRREVTFDEWDACVAAGACTYRPDDRGWGRGGHPVIDLSWNDTKTFVAWLSQRTGQKYRLPTEAEWEYAAHAGTTTAYYWGRDSHGGQANCEDCGGTKTKRTVPAGSFAPNAFALFDTAGNAAEWVEDCWNETYRDAPRDGSAWLNGQCELRVLRGGSFSSNSNSVRPAARFRYDRDVRYYTNGFRVVRNLP